MSDGFSRGPLPWMGVGDLAANQVEIAREMKALRDAMLDCRHQLMALSAGTEGHTRHMICKASNILSKALGLPESSHGQD